MGRAQEAVEFATEEPAGRPACSPTRWWARSRTLSSRRCCSASPPRPPSRASSLRISGALPAGAGIPPRDLVTVLGNLIDNAFDALADARTRRVDVRLSGTGDRLRVQVDDSGPGLDDAAAARVLDRGWTTKAEPGTGRGLGLALVVQVARRHDGDVVVGRSDLGGARFTVTLGGAG
ncbi:ATP-binding protein [Nocardioides convexus]|uniref:sensor histidine kinase n=1 Tax=Nocardioides convexus TaxID=2712224 RepID=UPI00241870F0|nr:ATP-binding protein [Nocardioides convexus]